MTDIKNLANDLYVTELARLLTERQADPLATFRGRLSDVDQLNELMIKYLATGQPGQWGPIRCTGEFLLGKPEGRTKEIRIAQRHESGRILVRRDPMDYRIQFILPNLPNPLMYFCLSTMTHRFGLEDLQRLFEYRNVFVKGPLREPHISAALFPDLLRGI